MSLFSAPWMLYGLAFASIPVIIHLLNRRRFLRIDWAPMQYLKLTLRTNRRKLQLEQWLLLAVRTLVLVLLFCALARPVVSGTAQWLGGKGRAARVLVIDDSPSMAVIFEGQSALDRAKRVAAELVRATSTKDQLTVFTTSQPDAPLIRQTQLEDPGPLLSAIDQLQPSDIAGQWSATLEHVERRLQEAAYPAHQVVLITDLRQSDWTAEVKSTANAWADREVALQVIDTGRPASNNVSIERLSLQSPVAIAGQPFQLEAAIHNYGDQTMEGQLATMRVAGVEQSVELPKAPAGETIVATISARIEEPGQHVIRLEIPADQQTRDDRRQLVVDVKQSVAVLLVDGEPGNGLQSETGFLQAALASGRAPWQVEVVDDLQWQDLDLARFDVVVLANVSVLSNDRSKALRQHVQRGRGLVICPGELLDPENYNRLLGGKEPLLPATLLPWEPMEESESRGLNFPGIADSPLAVLAAAPQLVANVKPRQIQRVRWPDPSSPENVAEVRVIATWNTPEQLPALLERRVGGGRVFLWTITADRQWSDWPQEPSYVLAMRETVLAAARQASFRSNVIAGQPLRADLPLAETPNQGEILTPSGDSQSLLLDIADVQQPHFIFGATRLAGVYQMQWLHGGQQATQTFAANIAPQESSPDRLADARLKALLDPLPVQLTIASGANGAGQGREVWRAVVWGMLLLLGVECALASWVSRER